MPEPALLVERDGHVVTLTLNRPGRRNAFNPEMLVRLADAWDMIDGDDDVRVAVLTGAGGDFSAGADLDELVGMMLGKRPPGNDYEQRVKDDYSLIFKGFLKDHRITKPVVAAVEGACFAGGTEILQALDVRVAAEGSRIAISEVQRGLFPMGGSTVRLRRQIPFTKAMELLLVGDPIGPEEAKDVGLVGRVVPRGEALAEAHRIAGRIARNGPLAVRKIKEAVIETEFLPEAEAFAREMEIGMAVQMSADAREGAQAFLEKREPRWKGR